MRRYADSAPHGPCGASPPSRNAPGSWRTTEGLRTFGTAVSRWVGKADDARLRALWLETTPGGNVLVSQWVPMKRAFSPDILNYVTKEDLGGYPQASKLTLNTSPFASGATVTLTDLEAVFRSLESELGLRPIYHHKPFRAEGHLFITVVAYQLVQVIRRRLRESSETASWTTLRRILEGQQRITATFRRADGRTLHVRKATRAEAPQQALYDALGVGSAPGGIRKSIM